MHLQVKFLGLFLVLFFTMLLLCSCNKNDELQDGTAPQEPFEIEAFNVRFIEQTGNQEFGCCGFHVAVTDTSENDYSGRYFTESLPSNIDTNNRVIYSMSFTGKLKVYPEESIECKDCMVDPLPGKEPPSLSLKKAEIIEMQVK